MLHDMCGITILFVQFPIQFSLLLKLNILCSLRWYVDTLTLSSQKK